MGIKFHLPRVMGIDPSTHTGVFITGDPHHAEVVEFPDSDGFPRLQLIAQRIGVLLEEHKPAAIFIEAPATRGAFNLVQQAYIAYAIRLECFKRGLDWWDVSISSLKLWTTGKGRADKKQMGKAVKDRWGYTHKDHNIIDAYALAKLGETVLTKGPIKGARHVEQPECK